MLVGSFKDMGIHAVLTFLKQQSQTGALVLIDGEVEVKIYLMEGFLVHAEGPDTLGVEAIKSIFSMINGRFEFKADQFSSGKTLESFSDDKLIQFLEKGYQANKSNTPQGSANVQGNLIPKFRSDKDPSKLKASNKSLKLLLSANGTHSLEQLANDHKVNLASVCKVFEQLHRMQYIDWVEKESTEFQVKNTEQVEEKKAKTVRYWRGKRIEE